jgi:hypothetical protein
LKRVVIQGPPQQAPSGRGHGEAARTVRILPAAAGPYAAAGGGGGKRSSGADAGWLLTAKYSAAGVMEKVLSCVCACSAGAGLVERVHARAAGFVYVLLFFCLPASRSAVMLLKRWDAAPRPPATAATNRLPAWFAWQGKRKELVLIAPTPEDALEWADALRSASIGYAPAPADSGPPADVAADAAPAVTAPRSAEPAEDAPPTASVPLGPTSTELLAEDGGPPGAVETEDESGEPAIAGVESASAAPLFDPAAVPPSPAPAACDAPAATLPPGPMPTELLAEAADAPGAIESEGQSALLAAAAASGPVAVATEEESAETKL